MSIVKDTIAITAITLVAGLALGVVQDITAGPIAQQQEQSKQEAYKAVFEDADSFEVYDVDADALAANLAENNFNAQTINEIMEAKDASGETIPPIIGLLLVQTVTSGDWLAPTVGMFGFALKPLGIKKLDNRQGAFYVMADDLLGGFYAAVSLIIIKIILVSAGII